MREYNIPELQDMIRDYANKSIKAKEKCFTTNEVVQRLEDIKLTRLEQIKSKFEGSESAKERLARVDKEWLDLLELMSETRVDANRAKLEFFTAERLWETSRTLLSTKRTELNQLNQ